jgi:hypothetical protein
MLFGGGAGIKSLLLISCALSQCQASTTATASLRLSKLSTILITSTLTIRLLGSSNTCSCINQHHRPCTLHGTAAPPTSSHRTRTLSTRSLQTLLLDGTKLAPPPLRIANPSHASRGAPASGALTRWRPSLRGGQNLC